MSGAVGTSTSKDLVPFSSVPVVGGASGSAGGANGRGGGACVKAAAGAGAAAVGAEAGCVLAPPFVKPKLGPAQLCSRC